MIKKSQFQNYFFHSWYKNATSQTNVSIWNYLDSLNEMVSFYTNDTNSGSSEYINTIKKPLRANKLLTSIKIHIYLTF